MYFGDHSVSPNENKSLNKALLLEHALDDLSHGYQTEQFALSNLASNAGLDDTIGEGSASEHFSKYLNQCDHILKTIYDQLNHHEYLMSTFFSSIPETSLPILRGDLDSSIRQLFSEFSQLSKHFTNIKLQAEAEQNATVARLRSIASLKLTLEEAEDQLERSRNWESRLQSLQKSHDFMKKRLQEHFDKDSKATQVDIIAKNDTAIGEQHVLESVQQSGYFRNPSTPPQVDVRAVNLNDKSASSGQNDSSQSVSGPVYNRSTNLIASKRAFKSNEDLPTAYQGQNFEFNEGLTAYSPNAWLSDPNTEKPNFVKLPDDASILAENKKLHNLLETKESLIAKLKRQLNSTEHQLQVQSDQLIEIEALLAERDSRITAQSNELNEMESQLASSTNVISLLRKRLSVNHHQLTDLLHRLNPKNPNEFDPTSAEDELPAIPAVLRLAANLDSVYSELQDNEHRIALAEHRASNAIANANQLKLQLEQLTTKTNDTYLSNQSRVDTGTQFDSLAFQSMETKHDEDIIKNKRDSCDKAIQFGFFYGNSITMDSVMKYALLSPQAVLNRQSLSNDFNKQSNELSISELQEALRNALSQIDRLKKCRSNQKSRYEQLQKRMDNVSSELDAAVDALRCHQINTEAERRRNALDVSHLRNQLAKTTALLERQRSVSHASVQQNPSFAVVNHGNLHGLRAASASPAPVRVKISSGPQETHSSDNPTEDAHLQLSIVQNELNQLKADMIQQRSESDRETSKLRGQLAEATSDARSLRLQLNRLISSTSSIGDTAVAQNSVADWTCTNCQKLQKLLDLLQTKQSVIPPDNANSTNYQERSMNTPRIPESYMEVSNEIESIRLGPPTSTVDCPKDLNHRSQSSVVECMVQTTSPTLVDACSLTEFESDTKDVIRNDAFVQTVPILHKRPENTITPIVTVSNSSIDLLGEEWDPDVLNEKLCENPGNYCRACMTKTSIQEEWVALERERSIFETVKKQYMESITRKKSEESPRDQFHPSDKLPDTVDQISHTQLVRRLKAAEEEAASALDQLKASNAEFLTLRERLSHATVERAHLKATIEGLDEQVSLLEATLYERNNELTTYRNQLVQIGLIEPTVPHSGKIPHSIVRLPPTPMTRLTPLANSVTQNPYSSLTRPMSACCSATNSTIVHLGRKMEQFPGVRNINRFWINTEFIRAKLPNLSRLCLIVQRFKSNCSFPLLSSHIRSQPRPKPAIRKASTIKWLSQTLCSVHPIQLPYCGLHLALNVNSDVPETQFEPTQTPLSNQANTLSKLQIDADEAVKFSKLSQHWWDLNGEFKSLQSMNSLRVPFIRNALCSSTQAMDAKSQVYAPLSGIKILDVGCGGGILSEPLARLGAHVTGIDEVPESIAMAKQHANLVEHFWTYPIRKPEYKVVNLTNLSMDLPGYFDAVVASEVLEHVSDWDQMIQTIHVCLKPGGMMFITTLNQTVTSLLLAVVAAEYVARIVPIGTHQWNKFIEPSKLQAAAIRHGFQTRQLLGMRLNPLTNRWSWTSDLSINYAMSAVKLGS